MPVTLHVEAKQQLGALGDRLACAVLSQVSDGMSLPWVSILDQT